MHGNEGCNLESQTLEKAILFAVGNTLVCDDLGEAKALSWSGERHKVVTVDGTLLTKSGTMTGGTSGGMEARSHKWDDKKIEGLKKKTEGFELELEELGSITEMQLKESEASGKISGLEKKIYLNLTFAMNWMSNAYSYTIVLTVLTNDLDGFYCLQLEKAITERASKILSLEKRINEIVDRIYKKFKWKFKSEVCEKDIQEWKKKISNATTSISKLNRQIKSKDMKMYWRVIVCLIQCRIRPKRSRKREFWGRKFKTGGNEELMLATGTGGVTRLRHDLKLCSAYLCTLEFM
ncbi:hypothetical protein TEA_006658 [Camellia sinensis var. sinensis]|uniref:Uncharacterized protein n=1 Tax=Camellia sinensis var. sinensis TaxID=542762 RepID=A0A4S4EZP2_CAMSN|nr:hypothetical protein TEA_006658 [Camellia sinensis var. sinensis]